jgi:hypothetical protein
MTEFNPTGRWRHRAEIADVAGGVRLILQVEESRTRGYGYNETEVQWRDAQVTDLAIPSQLVSQQASQWHEHLPTEGN